MTRPHLAASGGPRSIDWKAVRETIDLASVATSLLGPAPGRRGERGRRLWWCCPFHPDRNPSFCVDAGKGWWRCYGCGAHGDAAALVMQLNGVTFPEAVAYLTGGPAPTRPGKAPARPVVKPAPRPVAEPTGLPEAAALDLVADAFSRLWIPEGTDALAYLTDRRHLTLDTIIQHILGWVPEVMIPTHDGDRSYRVSGWVIPWFHVGHLAKVNIRQPDGRRPKYAEAFRNPARLVCYPGPEAIRAGRALVVTEGELDALCLGQELADLASVTTLGSASASPTPDILARMLPAPRWFIATDADEAGDKAAAGWPARAQRVRPPVVKDWTDAKAAGVDLARWWRDILAGVDRPPLFSWPELARWRWGDADEAPGVDILAATPEGVDE